MDVAAALCSPETLAVDESRRLRAGLDSLQARERMILGLRYGLDGSASRSLRDIGRSLGISGERVRQLEQRALKILGPDDATNGSQRVGTGEGVTEREASLPGEALEAWTLLLLRGQPAHGYELSKRLRDRGFASPGPRVYRLLRDLERRGLVRSDWTPSNGLGPRRRVYRLTSTGARRLHIDADTLRSFANNLQLFFAHYTSAGLGKGFAELVTSP